MKPDTRYLSTLAGINWPAVPVPTVANRLALLLELEQNQWRTPEAIAASQLRQLQQLLSFAADTVPHYRHALRGFRTEDLAVDAWADIPVLARRVLHESTAALRSESIPPAHGGTFPIRTSGSTGMVVEALGTGLTSLMWEVFCLRDHLWHRRDLGRKLCAIRYQHDPARKGPSGQTTAGWGSATDGVAVTGPCVNLDILLDIAHLAARLAAEQPAYLLTHPSLAMGLARHCIDHGIEVPGLVEVRTMGESADEALRELCRTAWRARVVDAYSCQEAGYLALQCPDHDHYHVQSENVLLEVVDERGQPCGPGEVGRVLVTSLNNFATPLIRYEIGDYAEVGPPCPCGRGLPVLKRVMGRYRNLLTLPDGSQRWPRLGYESSLQDIAPIDLMQMVQHTVEEIEVRLVMGRPLGDGERDALTTFLHDKLEYPFALRFAYVDDIRNPANGKVEQFISLIGQAP